MTYGAMEKLLSSGRSLGIKDYATDRAGLHGTIAYPNM